MRSVIHLPGFEDPREKNRPFQFFKPLVCIILNVFPKSYKFKTKCISILRKYFNNNVQEKMFMPKRGGEDVCCTMRVDDMAKILH